MSFVNTFLSLSWHSTTYCLDHGTLTLHRVFLALASDGGSSTKELEPNDIGTEDDSSRKGSFGRLRQRMTGNSNKSKSASTS